MNVNTEQSCKTAENRVRETTARPINRQSEWKFTPGPWTSILNRTAKLLNQIDYRKPLFDCSVTDRPTGWMKSASRLELEMYSRVKNWLNICSLESVTNKEQSWLSTLLFLTLSLQFVGHSISKVGISLAGLEQGQRSTTNQHTATTLQQDTVMHPASKVIGGLGPSRTGPQHHILLALPKGTGPKALWHHPFSALVTVSVFWLEVGAMMQLEFSCWLMDR